jgi:hypothetical protein
LPARSVTAPEKLNSAKLMWSSPSPMSILSDLTRSKLAGASEPLTVVPGEGVTTTVSPCETT